jgi:hypothetical protein
MTQPANAAPVGQTATGPALFGCRGLFGGIAAGFLGAGLFGLLFGQGFFGGMAGLTSQRSFPRFDSGEDAAWIGNPDEGLWIGIGSLRRSGWPSVVDRRCSRRPARSHREVVNCYLWYS